MSFISSEKIRDIVKIVMISVICLLMSPTVLNQWDSKAGISEQTGNAGGFSYAVNYAEKDDVIEDGGKLGINPMSYVFVSGGAKATIVETIPDEVLDKIMVSTEIITDDSAVVLSAPKVYGKRVATRIADSEVPLAAIKLDVPDKGEFRKIKELSFRKLLNSYNKQMIFYNNERTTMSMILDMFNMNNYSR